MSSNTKRRLRRSILEGKWSSNDALQGLKLCDLECNAHIGKANLHTQIEGPPDIGAEPLIGDPGWHVRGCGSPEKARYMPLPAKLDRGEQVDPIRSDPPTVLYLCRVVRIFEGQVITRMRT